MIAVVAATPMTGDGPGIESPARERLLEAATRLFCRYGINAVGVDTVVAEAGTAKATLYKAFGSKEKLVEAVLEREGRQWRDWFLAGLDTGEATPVERLRRIFPLLGEWFAQDRFYGCPFINAIGEHDKAEDRLRAITIAHKKAVLGRIESLALEAGAPDANRLAHQLGLLIDGAIVVAMISKDPGAALLAADAADSLLVALGSDCG
jgi:AcrR family transcriptional regulator